MAYEFLKKLFKKDENGTVIPMTAEELEAAIDADKNIKVVDLSGGGYVAKDKFDAKETELKGVKQQLSDANTAIQSYKDMDIDGIKKSAKDWEDKYNHDTHELNDKLAKQERDHQTDRYLDTVGLKPGAMYRDYVRRAFESKELKLENGKFIGADDVMKELKENPDFKDAFIEEKPDEPDVPDTPEQNPPAPNMPYFSSGTNSQTGEPKGSMFNFGFSGVRKRD